MMGPSLAGKATSEDEQEVIIVGGAPVGVALAI